MGRSKKCKVKIKKERQKERKKGKEDVSVKRNKQE